MARVHSHIYIADVYMIRIGFLLLSLWWVQQQGVFPFQDKQRDKV